MNRIDLFLQQKKLLDGFLENGTITRAQYDKSFGDLVIKMDMQEVLKMNEVYEFLKKCGTYYLSTVDGDQPRVRPFGTVDIYDGCLTIQTGKKKDVSKQIHANLKLEICAFDGEQWLRLAAKAVEVEAVEAAEHMLEAYPNLKAMYTPGDGNTEIFKLTEAVATFSSFTAPSREVRF